MDNAILFTSCLLFGWLVMYSYGFKRGYRLGREDEQDATMATVYPVQDRTRSTLHNATRKP